MSKPDASISVGADGSAFSKTIKAMEKNTDTMANSISAKLARMGQAFDGLKSIGRDAAGVITALTEPAAHLENVATSLGVVMGNAEAAERLTGSLERLATNGVVSFDELHRSARALTNVFKDDAVISHYVSRLADIAAGTDIPATRLAELVARMEDVGKAELTELSNKGVPIYEVLAEVMGKSRDEVVKLGNEGKVSCSAYLAALEKLTDEGGRYHQMNSKMSNTTKGSWDTLKASITECMAAIGEPINDILRPVLQDLASWIQNNKEEITAVGKGIVNVCTNVHTLTIGLGILAATMRGSMTAGMMRMAAGFKPIMAGLRSFRMAAALTGSYWRATMVGMAVATRAACAAIKGALASTLVGLGVVVLGEVLGWLYTKFSDAEDAAQDMGAAAEDATAATNDALEASRREMKLREEANRQERDRTQQMAEQARLAEEARRSEEQRLRAIEQQRKARHNSEFESEMDALRDLGEPLGGGTAGVVQARLRRVGSPSEEALYAERDRLESLKSITEEQKARYDEVTAAIGKIEEEHRKAAEAAREHTKEVEDLRNQYYDRRRNYNDARQNEAYQKLSIPAQQKQLQQDARAAGYFGDMNPEDIRSHLDALAQADAGAYAHQISALEKILELHTELVKRKQEYQATRTDDMQQLRIQALELAGRHRAAAALRDELALQQRITALREQGATEKQATEQAALEARTQKAAERQQKINSSRIELVQGSQAAVGGGGASIRIGDVQLKESKQQTKYLKEIFNALINPRSTVAVLA